MAYQCALRSFYIKLLYFSKFHFSKFSIDQSCFSTDRNCDKNFWFECAWLDWHSINAQSIETENFQFFKYLTKFFFIHHLCLGFTCIALFFCIHLAVLQSYLSLFSHIPCIHFAKLGTQLDLKIDWLIFESFVHFSICYFLCVNYRKYFS